MTTRKRYSLDDDLMPIVRGEVPIPNMETQPLALVAGNIAACGRSMKPIWGWANTGTPHKAWAFFFLTPAAMGSAMHNSFDGGGYGIAYGSKEPLAFRFAICKHDKRASADANPNRGWHPGSCVKCGLDMTIDSSD